MTYREECLRAAPPFFPWAEYLICMEPRHHDGRCRWALTADGLAARARSLTPADPTG